MGSAVTLIIFEGGRTSTPLEEQFRRIRGAVVVDLIAKAQTAGLSRILVCTPYTELAERVVANGVEVELEKGGLTPFHFGRRLWDVVRRRGLGKVLYMGGAAAPLISSQEIANLARIISHEENVVTANNFYSADIVGFSPGNALARVDLPSMDNALAMALQCDAGLRFVAVDKTLGLNFDVDTPGDLILLTAHPQAGENTRRELAKLSYDVSAVQRAMEVIKDPFGELLIAGRVGSSVFGYLDEHTRCRVRLYSEERGMKALGRDSTGEAVSLLGKLLITLGEGDFFAFLAEMADVAILDTRVLFAFLGWQPSQHDRFCSDLGIVEAISHDGLRSFTEAARASAQPVLLGGHSLVSGGLWVLVDGSLRHQNLGFGRS